jgi:DNA invertase Pin-like site-specific DNA recombinase
VATVIRVVAYYRMSTLRQEDSIERQRLQVLAWIEKSGYTLVAEYIDEGISGDEIARRREFQRLLRDARAGVFDGIVCDDKDRFGRFDSIDLGEIVAPLRRQGVWLETVAQGRMDWNSFAGRITDAVLQEAKRLEQEALSRRVLSNQLLRAKDGKDTGGRNLYGYRREPDPVRGNKYVPDGLKAEVVKLIFRMYDEGASLFDIVQELYRRGQPSPRGKPRWTRPVIQRLLINRRYLGDWTWGVHATGKRFRYGKGGLHPTDRSSPPNGVNPAEDWVVKPDSHEPLVDRDRFERVQARLQGNRKRTTPHPNGGKFLLTRLLVCGHCGSYLRGNTVEGERAYICGGYIAYGKDYCKRNMASERLLLKLLIGTLQRTFLDPANLQRLRQEMTAIETSQRSNSNLRRLRQQIDLLAGQIDQGNENLLLVPKDRIPGLVEKLRQKERQRDDLVRELKRAETESPSLELEERIAAAEAMLWRLEDALKDEELPLLREVLRELVSRVELHWTHEKTAKLTRCRLNRGVVYLRANEGLLQLSPSANQ